MHKQKDLLSSQIHPTLIPAHHSLADQSVPLYLLAKPQWYGLWEWAHSAGELIGTSIISFLSSRERCGIPQVWPAIWGGGRSAHFTQVGIKSSLPADCEIHLIFESSASSLFRSRRSSPLPFIKNFLGHACTPPCSLSHFFSKHLFYVRYFLLTYCFFSEINYFKILNCQFWIFVPVHVHKDLDYWAVKYIQRWSRTPLIGWPIRSPVYISQATVKGLWEWALSHCGLGVSPWVSPIPRSVRSRKMYSISRSASGPNGFEKNLRISLGPSCTHQSFDMNWHQQPPFPKFFEKKNKSLEFWASVRALLGDIRVGISWSGPISTLTACVGTKHDESQNFSSFKFKTCAHGKCILHKQRCDSLKSSLPFWWVVGSLHTGNKNKQNRAHSVPINICAKTIRFVFQANGAETSAMCQKNAHLFFRAVGLGCGAPISTLTADFFFLSFFFLRERLVAGLLLNLCWTSDGSYMQT